MVNLRILAPFAPGLPHGGSQRATALAERLEARDVSVAWTMADRRRPSAGRRAASALQRQPGLAAGWTAPDPGPTRPDVVLAAHSYLAGLLPAETPSVVDFHNLEHQHLRDVATEASGLRRGWLGLQAHLMERAERRAVAEHDLSLFTGDKELRWAVNHGSQAAGRSLVVPNRLPLRVERDAAAIKALRSRGTARFVAYIGTLRFPPNAAALACFLTDVWPHLRAVWPDLELHVAAGLTPPPAETLPTAAGVVHHGFVERLEPLLADAAAVVFPFSGMAGSSLRTLFLALAGVPLIGPAPAFRGHGASLGQVVETPQDWTDALDAALREPVAEAAASAATALQRDEAPWDALAARLQALAA